MGGFAWLAEGVATGLAGFIAVVLVAGLFDRSERAQLRMLKLENEHGPGFARGMRVYTVVMALAMAGGIVAAWWVWNGFAALAVAILAPLVGGPIGGAVFYAVFGRRQRVD